MTGDNPNRYRVSTKFTIAKIFISVGLFSIVFNLIRDFHNGTVTQKSIIGLTLGTLALTGVFYFFTTRKRIDYDDIEQILYIVDPKTLIEIAVPVERIDKILYSNIGGRGNRSYVIIYTDFYNQKQKTRLFPIPFDNSINTIIADTKLKNPNLVTRRWNFGLKAFF